MSFQKLQYCESAEENKAHEDRWGGYNQVPFGWQEMTPEEFAQCSDFIYCWDRYEHRQVHVADGEPLLSVQMFFFTNLNYGFAMHRDYWGKRVRYFRFGCKHEWRAPTPEEFEAHHFTRGRCMHAAICVKCGHAQEWDSSD